jgi:hypothetical protein
MKAKATDLALKGIERDPFEKPFFEAAPGHLPDKLRGTVWAFQSGHGTGLHEGGTHLFSIQHFIVKSPQGYDKRNVAGGAIQP